MTSAGPWRIGVSATDLFGQGEYLLHIDCFDDEDKESGAGCTGQTLTCNQTGLWSIDASACSDGGRPYNVWWIWGAPGDVLRLEMGTETFSPFMAIYSEDGTNRTQSTSDGSRSARLTYTVPAEGWYYVVVYPLENNAGGAYYIENRCVSSGCLFPYIKKTTPSTTAPAKGSRVFVTAEVDYYGGGPLFVDLIDAENGAVLLTSNTTTVQTPPIDRTRSFRLIARTECGSWTSDPFVLRPASSKRRSARR